ncbi:MAG: zf-TFIIB domain-containing protein [Ilumatobacter sp.]|nr:zf-TFIIB domain-containing protein [Ilumatobacter sp.]
MKCPTCPDSTLAIADRAGIEIDYCPTCRGVWLDRGELDRIIERSAAEPIPARQPQRAAAREMREVPEMRHTKYHQPYKKKKTSFLGDLFDF